MEYISGVLSCKKLLFIEIGWYCGIYKGFLVLGFVKFMVWVKFCYSINEF